MNSRKPMRSWFYYIVLVGVIALFVKALYGIFTVGINNLGDEVWGLIIAPLYVAAFILVPKLKFLQPVSTAPAVAPEQNAPLAAPARLTIIRDSSVVGMALAMGVFLDNQPACTIKNGESATVTLTMKHSVLRINATGSPSPPGCHRPGGRRGRGAHEGRRVPAQDAEMERMRNYDGEAAG